MLYSQIKWSNPHERWGVITNPIFYPNIYLNMNIYGTFGRTNIWLPGDFGYVFLFTIEKAGV